MKKFLFVVSGVALMSTFALAQDAATQAPRQNPCAQVKLTDAQKTQIKAAYTNFKAANAPLIAAVKSARQAFNANVADAKADLATAQTTSAALSTAQAQEQSARMTLKTEILFSVLQPEQRKPFLVCERLIKRRNAYRRHHGQHHGQHNGGAVQVPAQAQ